MPPPARTPITPSTAHAPGARKGPAIWPVLLLVFTCSVLLCTLWRPWLRPLGGDWAYRELEAMRLRQGQVCYRDFFMHKAPLASYLAAGGQAAAVALGAEPLLGTRLVSILLTGIVVALAAWAWANAEGSRAAGALAGLAFASMTYVGLSTASGIEPKMGMLAVGLAAILAAQAGRWVLAGAFTGAAALFWQPGVLFLLALAPEPLLLAWRDRGRPPQAHGLGTSLRAGVWPWAQMALGFAIPLGLAAAYFASQGALRDAWQQAAGFNLPYTHSYLLSFGGAVRRFGAIWVAGHGRNLDLLVLAGSGLCAYLVKRGPNWPAGRPLLTYGLLALIASLINMQDASDTVPLLPVVAPLAGVAIFRALRWLWRRWRADEWLGPLTWRGALALASGGLVAFGMLDALTEQLPYTLEQQRADVHALVYEHDPSGRVYAPGLPEAVVLTGAPALSRYAYLYNGVAAWIQATQPGGLRAMIAGVEAKHPGVVLVAKHPAYDPDYAPLYRWLDAGYKLEAVRIYDYYYLPVPAGFGGALLRGLFPGDDSPFTAGVTVGSRMWVWRLRTKPIAAQGRVGHAEGR